MSRSQEFYMGTSSGSRRELVSATNGFGLRAPVDEESERKRRSEESAYSLRAKRVKTEQDIEEYQNTLASIKLETEEQIMEKDKSDSEEEEESQEEGGVKQEPSEELDPNELLLYQNPDYNFFNVNYDTQLPIFEKRREIVDAVNGNTVVIIQGTTGCGKTTQVPQYILDDHANRNMRCRIVVTQPRRIAATSVSKRVSAERNWPWGSVCGYKVSMEKRFNEDTRIFYVTTGYLLEYLVANDLELDNIYTHVILDEIHDRDINTDFLLLLLRILLLRKSKLKIILMSATLDPQPLIDYFQNFNNNAEIPLVECKMRTYTVKKWYLDKIQNVIEYEAKLEFDLNLPEIHDEQLEVLVRLLDYIEKRELESLPADRETVNGFADVRGATLIFVPGMEEILRVQDYLKTNRPNSGFVFCQLHSEIALDQQMQVFKRASAGQRKIIISTSIAESSITVPDVKFVVDFCLTKQTFTDEITNYTSLEMCWASKSNLEQRRGRAGRVENGIYYALVSEELYSRFSDFPDPAIYREPLDKVVLNAKRICKKMAPKNILSLCLSVPRLNDLERTVIKLKECGALTLYKRNIGDDGRVRMEMSMYDGNLTFSGEIMACLPVDTRLGKLIVMGHAFGRLKEAIIIAAGLSVRKLFSSFHQSKLEFYMGKFNYAKGLMCDFEAILTVYWLWKRKQAEWEEMTAGLGDKQRSEIRRLEREWAKSSMLDEKKLKDMQKIIDEIEHRLKSSFEIEVQESDYCNDNINREATDENSALDQYYIIKLMCAAAFYPNYFKTIYNDQMETEMIRQLCGKNPKTTIQVKGLEDPAIYHVRLKNIFKACGDKVIMHYDRSKAYVEFSDYYEVNERISSGVYFALFLGKMLRAEKLILPPARSAFHFERLLRIMRNTEVNNYEMTCSSRISSGTQSANEDADRHIRDLKEFKMTIVQVESMNSFWAQVKEPEYLQTLESIHNTLNSKQYKFELHSREDIYIGMLVVSLFMSENDSAFYRAKVISTTRDYVEVIFIDYGNIERKDYTLIYKITDELKKIPSQAIQCSLAFARPNPFLSDAEKEKKLDDTILYLDRIRNLKAKVYSVVHNIVRVILINMDHPLYEFDILTDLVKLKLYERCDESRISKENNENRMQSSLLIPRDTHNRSKNEWIHLDNLDNILKDVEYDENAPMSRWHHFTVTSPIQTGLEGMTRAARNTQIKPDTASINAIILDDNPSLRCSSLLISYKIDINTQTRACRLRESTLFPKINGIVSLCLLAFSPQVELRYSKKTRCYTGALCGLGFDRIEKKPMYVENDIEDVFDTVITNNDIKDINTIRYQLNLLMGNKRTSMGIIQKSTVLKEYQQHLRGLCLKLLKETRETMNETILFEYPHRWNKIPEHHYNPLTVLQKQEFEMRKRNRIFYEPIRTVDFTKINQ